MTKEACEKMKTKRYMVTVSQCATTRYQAVVRVEAASKREATRKARDLALADKLEWGYEVEGPELSPFQYEVELD